MRGVRWRSSAGVERSFQRFSFLHPNFNANFCDHIRPTMNPARYLAGFEKLAPFYFQTILSFASSSTNPELADNCFENAKKRREKWTKTLKFSWKSVSFVGLVEGPLNVHKIDDHKLLVWTFFRVRPSCEPTGEFRVLLKMWNKIAESCIGRVKPNDLIYVEGPLQSYKRTDMNGGSKLLYEITAKKLNHVDEHGPKSRNQSSEDIQSEDVRTRSERQKDRLYLWHVFFSSPNEWYDNRKTKFYPNQPDFKHKDTREALWLKPDDPPWIMKQLHMLDAGRTEENKHGCSEPHGSFSKWL